MVAVDFYAWCEIRSRRRPDGPCGPKLRRRGLGTHVRATRRALWAHERVDPAVVADHPGAASSECGRVGEFHTKRFSPQPAYSAIKRMSAMVASKSCPADSTSIDLMKIGRSGRSVRRPRNGYHCPWAMTAPLSVGGFSGFEKKKPGVQPGRPPRSSV